MWKTPVFGPQAPILLENNRSSVWAKLKLNYCKKKQISVRARLQIIMWKPLFWGPEAQIITVRGKLLFLDHRLKLLCEAGFVLIYTYFSLRIGVLADGSSLFTLIYVLRIGFLIDGSSLFEYQVLRIGFLTDGPYKSRPELHQLPASLHYTPLWSGIHPSV